MEEAKLAFGGGKLTGLWVPEKEAIRSLKPETGRQCHAVVDFDRAENAPPREGVDRRKRKVGEASLDRLIASVIKGLPGMNVEVTTIGRRPGAVFYIFVGALNAHYDE